MVKNIFLTLILLIFIISVKSSFASCAGVIDCSESCDTGCTKEVKAGQCECVQSPSSLIIDGKMIDSPVPFVNLGQMFSALLPYIFVIAGLILFFLLITNGLKMLTSGGNPKTTEAAKSGLTAAVVGFIIIFVSYWLIQLAEYILHINILGGP